MFSHALLSGRCASSSLKNKIKTTNWNGFIDGLPTWIHHGPCASITLIRRMYSTDTNTPNLIQQEKDNLIEQVSSMQIHTKFVDEFQTKKCFVSDSAAS